MKKYTALILVSVFLGIVGCDSGGKTQEKEASLTEENQKRLIIAVPPPKLTTSMERTNLKERLLRFNDENKVSYIYLINYGRIMAFYAIKGKVSSVNSNVVKKFLDGSQTGESLNMSIDGNVLSSYSLPIAAMLIDGKGKWLLINGDSSTVTTNNHISEVLGQAYSRKDLRQTPIPFSAMQSAGIISSLNYSLHDVGDKEIIHLIDAKKDI